MCALNIIGSSETFQNINAPSGITSKKKGWQFHFHAPKEVIYMWECAIISVNIQTNVHRTIVVVNQTNVHPAAPENKTQHVAPGNVIFDLS